jgi:hypothetical protein
MDCLCAETRGCSTRSLPFADATFDRVLAPGGRLVIADIRGTKHYVSVLRSLNAENVDRRRLGWRCWWGNPVAATSLVTASKV